MAEGPSKRGRVSIDATCCIWLDVAAFEESLSQAERETADGGLAALREAVDLYAGDFLEGCYDEWVLEEREDLRQRYLEPSSVSSRF